MAERKRLDPYYQTVLDELDVAPGQLESELKMHLGMSQRSSLLGSLEELRNRGLVRCDGAGRWWPTTTP